MSTRKCDATIPTNIVAARRDRDVRPHFLEQAEGEGAPQKFTLDRPQLIIGRAEDADVRVQSQRASRQHAILSRRGVDYVLRDNDSRNGVFLNGVQVYSAILRDGDILQVADSVFIYHEG
ncbi:MAG: FHA domain-containing protein [Verrucomicrobiota bacterium]